MTKLTKDSNALGGVHLDGIAPARDGERATAQAGSRKASAVGRSLRSFIGRRRADPSDDGASSRSRSQARSRSRAATRA